jgi:hypothetical protein
MKGGKEKWKGSICRAIFWGIAKGMGVWLDKATLWLFNIAMENGPLIDGLPGFTY